MFAVLIGATLRLDCGRVYTRRPSRIRKPPSTINQYVPKSLELEQRIARVEYQLRELSKRLGAVEAQIDHLLARVRLMD